MSENKHSMWRAIAIGVFTSLVVGAIIYGVRAVAAKRKLPKHLATRGNGKQPDGADGDSTFRIDRDAHPTIEV